MTEELIREIATQIFNEQILLNWKFYLLFLFLLIIASISGSYISMYSKKSAELKAIQDNYSNILRQLKQNTAVAEEIKTQVNHSDWNKREWKTLRRIKLEELLTTVHENMTWLEAESSTIRESGKFNETQIPVQKALTITRLYFPELNKDMQLFYNLTYEYRKETLDSLYGIHMSKVDQDSQMLKSNYSTYISIFEKYNKKLINIAADIEKNASGLMKSIMEV